MFILNKYKAYGQLIAITAAILLQINLLKAQEIIESEAQDTIVYPPNILDLLQKGDEFFNQRYYEKANKYYFQALDEIEEDPIITLKIADAYRLNQQCIEAEKYYASALEDKEYNTPTPYLHYADILLKNKKYNKAQTWFEYYNSLIGNNSPIAGKFIRSIENLEEYFADSLYFSVKSLNINSPESDFSPAMYKDGLVFVSSRQLGTTEIGKRYYDLYYSKFNDSTNTYNKAQKLSNQMNTKYHEGPLVFYQDYNQLLLTRSNYEEGKKNTGEVMTLSIFESSIENLDSKLNEFSKIKIENFDYSMAHPAISRNGKTLFFISNAQNGYGNTDIYKTTLTNGKWTSPQNMGSEINTSRNEMFLFLHNDSILYFSSDGHGGLGGLDIYRVNLSDKNAKVKNLGYPINSNKDDFGLIFTKNINKGYFSSNRSGGMGSDDIYSFEIKKVKFKPVYKSQDTGEAISDIIVEVKDLESNKLLTRNNKSKSLEFDLKINGKYSISFYSDKYKEENKIVTTNISDLRDIINPIVMTIELKTDTRKEEGIIFRVQVAASKVPLSTKKLKKRYKGNLPTAMFKEEGWYKYIIGEFDSYYQAKEVLKTSGVKDAFIAAYKDKENKLALKQAIIEKYIAPDQNKKQKSVTNDVNIDIKNHFIVHFDYDRSYISNKSKIILDSVINIIKANSDILLEINGHTDIKGTKNYNMALSNERTNNVYNYVVSKNDFNSRIVTNYYGESKLLKYCNRNCTEKTHKINRRVEIILYNINK